MIFGPAYLHSEIQPLERTEIIRELRLGKFDVLVGINLLREGLDIPEVGFIGILDADKEGFLRDEKSLIQTIGRASRNANSRVVLYADRMTGSIKKAMETTERRRSLQMAYNQEHGIIPQTIRNPSGKRWWRSPTPGIFQNRIFQMRSSSWRRR